MFEAEQVIYGMVTLPVIGGYQLSVNQKLS